MMEVEYPARKQSFEVEILGIPYRIKSTHDEAFVKDLVEQVNKKLHQVLHTTPGVGTEAALVLCLLNMAEELSLLKERARFELEEIEQEMQAISAALAKAMKVPKP